MSDPHSESISISKHAVRRFGLAVGGAVALVVVVLLVIAALQRLTGGDTLAGAINSNEYQSVVLTNGQIYFGKLSAPGGDFYYLRHAYYLTSTSTRGGTAQQRVLAPIVKDIHTPEDLMVINRSQIVYMENLKPTGQVSRRIQQAGP